MSKRDDLVRSLGGNVAESMGSSAPAPMHGATPRQMPPRLLGISRPQNAAVIAVGRITPDPDQPREEFEPDALARLAESLKTRGQISPIMVRWDDGRGLYVIVCGERRWRAATMAGLATVQCVIADGPASPGEFLALQVIENCVREDLRPIEQAQAFRALMGAEGISGNQLAKALGIDPSNVTRALALLDLPSAVQDRVEQGTLAPSVAYEVSKLADAVAQAEIAGRAVAEGLSRAEVVKEVRRAASGPGKPSKGRGAKAKPRKTSATIRTPDGYKVTIENRRGIDEEGMIAAMIDALDQLRAKQAGRADAA